MRHAEIRAREVIRRLPDQPCTGAEIGVYQGLMSLHLLNQPMITLYMVDNWKAMPKYHVTQADQDENYQIALRNTSFASERRVVYKMDSADAVNQIENGSLDFVFIDADHSYIGCQRDIVLWLPKVKPDGLLCGHDYNNPDEPYGLEVKQAVDEFAREHSHVVHLGDNYTWFIHL